MQIKTIFSRNPLHYYIIRTVASTESLICVVLYEQLYVCYPTYFPSPNYCEVGMIISISYIKKLNLEKGPDLPKITKMVSAGVEVQT